jgi:VIT1/CCC1 family predicted Fe2+/Mn2+ transporter
MSFKRISHEYPPYQHLEKHFEAAETVRDIIIGLSDGLTVPFAITAGLSSLGSTRFVVYAGVSELVSGSISMGLGGYLAALSEADHYKAERQREEREVVECPLDEEEEVYEILEPYGLDRDSLQPVIKQLKSNPKKFVDFMMRFELGLEMPDPRRSWISALTIGLAYFIGGLIPLFPYFFTDNTFSALIASIILTSASLFVFGLGKSYYMPPRKAVYSALQTLLCGAIAAAASYGIVYAIPKG